MSWFLLFVVQSIMLCGAVLFLVRRIERRIQPTVILEQIRSEIDELMVEFNQTTERNIGLIEERIQRLSRLIEEADRRSTVLRRDLDAHQGPVRAYGGAPAGRRSPASNSGGGAQPDGSGAARPTDAESVLPETPRTDSGGRSDAGPEIDKRAQVIDLHEKGIAANIIAARVGMTVGEVELIVSLTQRKR